MNTLYKQLLLFPDRAENLGQFSAYDVDLEHWKGLSSVFRQTFQAVYERGSSAVLLVHGAQGTGKTLFSRRLEQDFNKATEGAPAPDKKNLWHTLVGDDPPTRATIETATQGSDFRRSIFLLLSNDAKRMRALEEHIDQSHAGLAKVLELPLPAPAMKEQIVRKNTNRLNRMSYWYCLDAAGKEERLSVYDVLEASDKGFTDSFLAVSEALRSADVKRTGRPANRNLITLVTLGTPPSAAKGFLEDHDLAAQEHHRGDHLGVWLMREQWASMLYQGNDREASRRAQMLESEFALRWVALDMRATFALCQPPSAGDLGERLLHVIRFVPSIAKPGEVRRAAKTAPSSRSTCSAARAPRPTSPRSTRNSSSWGSGGAACTSPPSPRGSGATAAGSPNSRRSSRTSSPESTGLAPSPAHLRGATGTSPRRSGGPATRSSSRRTCKTTWMV
jgi:hypothetical protein